MLWTYASISSPFLQMQESIRGKHYAIFHTPRKALISSALYILPSPFSSWLIPCFTIRMFSLSSNHASPDG